MTARVSTSTCPRAGCATCVNGPNAVAGPSPCRALPARAPPSPGACRCAGPDEASAAVAQLPDHQVGELTTPGTGSLQLPALQRTLDVGHQERPGPTDHCEPAAAREASGAWSGSGRQAPYLRDPGVEDGDDGCVRGVLGEHGVQPLAQSGGRLLVGCALPDGVRPGVRPAQR